MLIKRRDKSGKLVKTIIRVLTGAKGIFLTEESDNGWEMYYLHEDKNLKPFEVDKLRNASKLLQQDLSKSHTRFILEQWSPYSHVLRKYKYRNISLTKIPSYRKYKIK